LLVVVFGENPANAGRHAIVEIQEVEKGSLKVEDDGAVVDNLNAFQLVVKRLGVHPFVVFVGPLDICRGEGVAIVEFEARTQAEARFSEGGRDLKVLSQVVSQLPLGRGLDERVVHQVIIVLLGNGGDVLKRVKPARVQGNVHTDSQGALGFAPNRRDLGVLDV